jgi:Mg-chelatase subunit ChlD
MRSIFATLLLLASATASIVPAHSPLYRRAATETCDDLSISSNNGNRKIAIVIDSSSSMGGNDPRRHRIAAARALNEFLVSNSEASGGQKPDQVAVIQFASSAIVEYPLGDPANADPAIAKIGNNMGGTNIGEYLP